MYEGLLGVIAYAIFLVVGVGWFFGPYSWTNAVWYAAEYKVGLDQVHTNDKPSDCDWSRAPLGNKDCHYKSTVGAYNAAGVLVGGDDAPKYSREAKTNKPIISYDDGKTWDWIAAIFDLTIKTVRVGWVKVME